MRQDEEVADYSTVPFVHSLGSSEVQSVPELSIIEPWPHKGLRLAAPKACKPKLATIDLRDALAEGWVRLEATSSFRRIPFLRMWYEEDNFAAT